jgi:hypothetical protein
MALETGDGFGRFVDPSALRRGWMGIGDDRTYSILGILSERFYEVARRRMKKGRGLFIPGPG